MNNTPPEHIIPKEGFAYIADNAWQALNSAPFEKGDLDFFKGLLFFEQDEDYLKKLDIERITKIAIDLENNLNLFKNINTHAGTLVDIQIGKFLLLMHNVCKLQKVSFSNWCDTYLDNKMKKDARYDRINAAKLPNSEMYCFLGIVRLSRIYNVYKKLKEDGYKFRNDPIAEILTTLGYEHEINQIQDIGEFSLLVDSAINMYKFKKVKCNVNPDLVKDYTESNGTISLKQTRQVAIDIKNGIPEEQALFKKYVSTKSTTKKIKSSSYNRFEEVALELITIMENIIDEDYVPEFDPSDYLVILKLIEDFNGEVQDFWSMSWEGFDLLRK